MVSSFDKLRNTSGLFTLYTLYLYVNTSVHLVHNAVSLYRSVNLLGGIVAPGDQLRDVGREYKC